MLLKGVGISMSLQQQATKRMPILRLLNHTEAQCLSEYVALAQIQSESVNAISKAPFEVDLVWVPARNVCSSFGRSTLSRLDTNAASGWV